jgi:P21-Rho-binding domain
MLSGISNIERIDMKPYCLLLETTDRRFYLSLKNDEELYGWLDDVYSRSPLMGVSNPTNFVHKVHVGFDPVSGAFTVCSSWLRIHNFFLNLTSRACRTNGANCSLNPRLREKTMLKIPKLSWMSWNFTQIIRNEN